MPKDTAQDTCDREIVTTRVINAARELVFKAKRNFRIFVMPAPDRGPGLTAAGTHDKSNAELHWRGSRPAPG